MSLAAQKFRSTLDGKNLKYEYLPQTEKNPELIRIGLSGNNMPSLRLTFFFDDDGERINIKCFSIAKANENALMTMYVKLNELNAKYRWVKFYIDADNEVTAAGDAIVDTETAGEECFEICVRYFNIIDECYPEIMKAIWA